MSDQLSAWLGRPVSATLTWDQPNIREILRDGETAVLFDPQASGAIWRAIQRLAGDPALRARLGEAARAEIARRDYTWRGNAVRVVDWALQG